MVLLEHTFKISLDEIISSEYRDYIQTTQIEPWLDGLSAIWLLDDTLTVEEITELDDWGGRTFRASVYASPREKDLCHNCGRKIQIAIFKGGEWCSDDCRKALGKDAK